MSALRDKFNAAAPKLVLRSFWFGVVPALGAVLSCRYVMPSPLETRVGSVDETLARAAAGWSAAIAAALFVFLSWLVHYWRSRLPGARWLLLDTSEGTSARRQPDAAGSAPRSGRWLGALGLILAGSLAAAAALLLRHGGFELSRVLSGSMLPSFQQDDLLVVNKTAYRASFSGAERALPRRGDVITFRRPQGVGGPEQVVKRVIGLPGDRISMRGSLPVINGWKVPTCEVGQYAYAASGYAINARLVVEFLGSQSYLTIYSPLHRAFRDSYEVKAGEVFVLGDNRNDSHDSRSWNGGQGAGLLPEAIDGRVEHVLAGKTRSGRSDFSKLLRPLGLELNLEGIEAGNLKVGVERCLAERPAVTSPP